MEAMTDIVRHRGPDGRGLYFGPNFALGHRRLAIIDLSKAGHQPMEYLNKYTITYNGEVYNYLEIRQELEKDGFKFTSTTDTEVILASYVKWGEDCVSHFNGMWAFVIYDREKHTLFCSRDRFGVKPLYFHDLGDLFAIASEIKQFTVLPSWQAKLNRPRAYDFLTQGVFDHTEETMFANVFQLRGGHNLTYDVRAHNKTVKKWYDLEGNIRHEHINFAEAGDIFRELFISAVKLRLRSDVKVGSCLSGGLDSSAIVCVMNEILKNLNASDKQETVSSCFSIKEYDEQEFIDEVIQKTGALGHKIFPDIKTLFSEMDSLAWHQDEPFGSTSIFAQRCVFKEAAKNNLTVMLDGQGSDEQLAGYHPFYGAMLSHLLTTGHPIRFLQEAKYYKSLLHHNNRDILKNLYRNMVPETIRQHIRQYTRKTSYSWLNTPGVFIDQSASNTKKMSLKQILFTGLPMLLHYEDRNSMTFSIESRVPFLDYRLVEFTLGLPDSFKMNKGRTKYVLREGLKNIIPNKILTRYDKMAFATPEYVWIQQNWDIFRKELDKTVEYSNGLICPNVSEAMKYSIDKVQNADYSIWRLIAFGRWLKLFNVIISN
jgi:asparagine synthase (glutamine-hydrolysing)